MLPLQQFVYRQLMYLVLIQSTLTALTGARLRWQKLRPLGHGGGVGVHRPPTATSTAGGARLPAERRGQGRRPRAGGHRLTPHRRHAPVVAVLAAVLLGGCAPTAASPNAGPPAAPPPASPSSSPVIVSIGPEPFTAGLGTAPTVKAPVAAPARNDLADPGKKDVAMQLLSSAENSSLDWRAQYRYIEDIGDGRGYTGGIVGFCSGTGDMLNVVQRYARQTPGNLARPVPAGAA